MRFFFTLLDYFVGFIIINFGMLAITWFESIKNIVPKESGGDVSFEMWVFPKSEFPSIEKLNRPILNFQGCKSR